MTVLTNGVLIKLFPQYKKQIEEAPSKLACECAICIMNYLMVEYGIDLFSQVLDEHKEAPCA